MQHARPLLPKWLASLALGVVVLAAPTSRLFARGVYIGTWDDAGAGRVYRYVSGTSWQDISPPAGLGSAVWDLEWIDGNLWAAGTKISSNAGFLARYDGSAWHDVTPPGASSPVTTITVLRGKPHATVRTAGLFRLDASGWIRVGTAPFMGQAVVSDCQDGRTMLFIGQDHEDEFCFHDPDSLTPCAPGCPATTGQVCSAGCFGGSCIYTMAEFDDGTGKTVYAGAYSGKLYSWDRSATQFAFAGRVGASHVTALAAFDGRLFLGNAGGELFAGPTVGTMTTLTSFGSGHSISELERDDSAHLLWIGLGSVPLAYYAAAGGPSNVWTWDGASLVERGIPGSFGEGVLSMLVVDEAEVTITCEAGVPQVVECTGSTNAVVLDASATSVSAPPGTTVDYAWSGDFVEGLASGVRPTVHYDSFGPHAVSLTVSAGGQVSACTTLVDLVDSQPPHLDIPPSGPVDCRAIPAPPIVTASDACDAALRVILVEQRIDGPCADTYSLQRTWTSTDAAGNATTGTQVLDVHDATPPVIAGAPADVVAACGAIPAPVTLSAADDCDPAPAVSFAEAHIDGRCPGDYTLRRTWTATDRCGNAASATQVVRVVDIVPPEVASSGADLACIWPPNHRMVRFTRVDFAPRIADPCSGPVTWRLAGCASDQPADAHGDGNTEPDCAVDPAGDGFAVRAERDGRDPAGRHYAVTIVAVDACGNESTPTQIGRILVPHDASPGCRARR